MVFTQIGSNIIGGSSFGKAISLISLSSNGTVIAVGASSSEYVRVYAFESGSWQQRGSDISGEASSNFFGGAVSISSDGNTGPIGATNNNDGGNHNVVFSEAVTVTSTGGTPQLTLGHRWTTTLIDAGDHTETKP